MRSDRYTVSNTVHSESPLNSASGVSPKHCGEWHVCEALSPRPLFALVMLGFDTGQYPGPVFVYHFTALPLNLTSRVNEYR